MLCGKCNSEISNTKESIKCADCNMELHVTCCRIRTVSKLASMKSKAIAEWRCDECVSSRSDSEDPKVIDLLKSIQREMAQSNKDHKASFVSLETSLATINAALTGLQLKVQTLEEENTKLQKSQQELEKDNKRLQNEVYGLQSTVEDLQQYSRNRNIEIRGIPETKNEDVYKILTSVAAAIGVEYARGEVSIAHRLQRPKNRAIPPAIIAQFISRSVRAAWLAAAKRKHITAKDVSASFSSTPVYVNEHLTYYNKTLLGRSKSMVHDGHLAHAWVRDGRVFIRKTSESPAVKVRVHSDIDTLAAVTDSARPATATVKQQ